MTAEGVGQSLKRSLSSSSRFRFSSGRLPFASRFANSRRSFSSLKQVLTIRNAFS